MENKELSKQLCAVFNLKGITSKSYVHKVECILVGLTFVKVPNRDYKLFFTIYPLWRSTLKSCIDVPLLLQRIKLQGFNPDLRWKMQVAKTDRFILSDNEYDDYNRLDMGLSPLLPIALDFLSQYDSIDSIDRLFNTMPIEQYSPYCSGLYTHCMVGLISAKLSKNADYLIQSRKIVHYIWLMPFSHFVDLRQDQFFDCRIIFRRFNTC